MKLRFDVQSIALALVVIITSLLLNLSHENYRSELIKSDGRGYYAYLPALILHNDPTFKKGVQAERQTFEGRSSQTYLFQHNDGTVTNKYFPGVAVLQSPFFVIGTGLSYLLGYEVNGYSPPFLWMFLLGSIFYAALGLLLLYKVLLKLNTSKKSALISILIVFFGSQVFFNTVGTPSFSHNYSFFLFALLMWGVVRYSEKPNLKKALSVGITIGLIFLVRPTNILFVLFIPFILAFIKRFKAIIKRIRTLKNGELSIASLSLLLTASLLPIAWYWQTGSWWVWSYNGEGFTFLSPHFWETIVGFRIGLLWHTPLVVLAVVITMILLFKKNTAYFIWLFYLVILIYVTSSWWCWDYEWVYGHRAFTEHFIILAFPISQCIKWKKKYLFGIGLVLIFAYNGMRFYQLKSGSFPIQRFTKSTYVNSFFDFSIPDHPHYYFLKHCRPLGEVDQTQTLKYASNETSPLTDGAKFTPALAFNVNLNATKSRFVFEATFDKRLTKEAADWQQIYLVFDAVNTKTNRRHYEAIPIFEYYKEAKGYWHQTIIQNEILLAYEPMEKLAVYLWNPTGKKVEITNFQISMEEIQTQR